MNVDHGSEAQRTRGRPDLHFRAFDVADREECLGLFDANCPESFAPNEREDYAAYLDHAPAEYEVCVDGERVVGAFGLALTSDSGARARVTWILLDPACQGRGLGRAMMQRALGAARAASVEVLDIAASHRSAAFFARFGAREVVRTNDGWGPGMHRVDMELSVEPIG